MGQVGVEEEARDAVEEAHLLVGGPGRAAPELGELVPRAPVGLGQALVEEVRDLVRHLRVRLLEYGHEHGVAALLGLPLQRLVGVAAASRGEELEAVRVHGRDVQPVGADAAQVMEFGDLVLYGLRGVRRRAVLEPREGREAPLRQAPGHAAVGRAPLRDGQEQPVELRGPLGGQDVGEGAVGLPDGPFPGRGRRPLQPVEGGPHELVRLQPLGGQGDEQGLVVVLERPLEEPRGEGFEVPFGGPAVAQVVVDELEVVRAGLPAQEAVLPYRLGRGAHLLAYVPEHGLGRGCEVVGAEAQIPHGAQSEGEAQAHRRRRPRRDESPVRAGEGEVGEELLLGDLLREPGEAGPLGVGERPYGHE